MFKCKSVKRIVNFITRRWNPAFDLTLIFLLGIIPFFRTGVEGVIYPIDTQFPLYPINSLFNSLYLWYSSYPLFGIDATLYLTPALPYKLPLAFLAFLGVAVPLIQRFWFILLFSFAGWSMYYLTSVVVRGDTRRQACLVASVFYMFNPWVILMIRGGGLGPYLLTYAALPLVLGLYIKGLNSEGDGNKYAILCGIGSAAFVLVTIQLSVLNLILFAFYLVFFIATNRKVRARIWHALRFTAKTALLGFIINLWWILPMLCNWSSIYEWQSTNTDFLESLRFCSQFSPLTDAARLLGSEHGSLPLGSFYSSVPGYLLGFIITILVYLPLLFKNRSKHVVFFSLAALVFTFLNMGSNPPFGSIYKWLLLNMPLGKAVIPYDPARWAHFLALTYAVLFGIASVVISQRLRGLRISLHSQLRNRLTSFLPVLASSALVILLFSYSWPLLTGNLRGYIEPMHVPAAYDDSRMWLEKQDDDFRIFVLPPPQWCSYLKYKWSPSASVDILETTLPKPLVEYLPSFRVAQNDIPRELTLPIYENGTSLSSAPKVLALMDVKYILFRRDLDPSVSYSTELTEVALQQWEGIHVEESFGELDFYRNEYWHPLHVYATSQATLVGGGIDSMFQVIASDSLTPGESALFLSEQVDPSQWRFLEEYKAGSSAPEITFQKVNPTKYQVRVENATKPFFLILSESYAPKWKAYVNSQGDDTNWFEAFFQKSIPDDKHFLVNGYANAWYIDPAEPGTGAEFSITLYYQPQSSFYLGCVISGLTLVVCVIFLVWGWRMGRRLKTRD